MQAVINYFKNSIQEFNNITWPTRKQAIRISTIVMIFMAVSAVFFGFIDQFLAMGYKALLSIKF